MIGRLLEFLLLLSALAAAAGPAAAQRVEPMAYDLAPLGEASQRTLRITNNREAPLTVEMRAFRLDLSDTGAETLIPADDVFLIFPPQAIIAAGATQAVRVRYLGEPDLAASQAYRVEVRQIPVDWTGSGDARLGVAVSFLTLAQIVPDGAEPGLRIERLEPRAEGGWRFVLVNDGARYARLSEYQWRLSGPNGESRVIEAAEAHGALGEPHNLIAPGAVRVMDTPALAPWPADQVGVTVRWMGR
jgi:fimbrial chaperone protein